MIDTNKRLELWRKHQAKVNNPWQSFYQGSMVRLSANGEAVEVKRQGYHQDQVDLMLIEQAVKLGLWKDAAIPDWFLELTQTVWARGFDASQAETAPKLEKAFADNRAKYTEGWAAASNEKNEAINILLKQRAEAQSQTLDFKKKFEDALKARDVSENGWRHQQGEMIKAKAELENNIQQLIKTNRELEDQVLMLRELGTVKAAKEFKNKYINGQRIIGEQLGKIDSQHRNIEYLEDTINKLQDRVALAEKHNASQAVCIAEQDKQIRALLASKQEALDRKDELDLLASRLNAKLGALDMAGQEAKGSVKIIFDSLIKSLNQEAAISYRAEQLIKTIESLAHPIRWEFDKDGIKADAMSYERSKAPGGGVSAPIVVNFSSVVPEIPKSGPAFVKVGQINYSDPKYPAKVDALGKATAEVINHALIGAALGATMPTQTTNHKRSEGVDKMSDEYIETLRDAFHSHKADHFIQDLIDADREKAFDEGREQGYEEGLEAQDHDQEETTEPKGDRKMETVAIALDRTSKAATRLAVKQFIKTIKAPLLAKLAGHLGSDDPSLRARAAEFLDSDLGEALLMGMLSLALGILPNQFSAEKLEALKEELQVSALTNVGDVVADLMMDPLRSVLADLATPAPAVKPVPALPAESNNVKVSIPANVPAAVPVLK